MTNRRLDSARINVPTNMVFQDLSNYSGKARLPKSLRQHIRDLKAARREEIKKQQGDEMTRQSQNEAQIREREAAELLSKKPVPSPFYRSTIYGW